ncbi:MAG: signal peptidase I [Candidatus Kapabacteria bacterium]|nr:signal peptidase I [Candidatus Kapabacteria bacterium]
MDPVAMGGLGLMGFLPIILVVVLQAVCYWKLFEKAGRPGWQGIIPVANLYFLTELVGKPVWWFIVILLVPCVNIVFIIMLNIELAKAFGKTTGYGILLTLFSIIFLPILAFGDAKYVGPAGGGNNSDF